MHESPASDRRHGSCQTVRDLSTENCEMEENTTSSLVTGIQNDASPDTHSVSNAAPPRAATGAQNGCALTQLTVAALSGPSVTIQREFEPLIGSSEAARLLGNIHVKTLQRYARHGRLPAARVNDFETGAHEI
jgi:hypothetical protein